MELDLEVCRAIAVHHGLPLQFVFKEFQLMAVLGKIASFVSNMPGTLVLKGGTALNKAYIKKMQRFSEDVDFDFVSNNANSRLLGFSKELAAALTDYEIGEFRKVRGTIQFCCGYETPLGGKDHVRVDISPKRLVTARPLESRSIDSEFTHSSVTGIKIYAIEDLTARKMHALASRAEGKDTYDVSMALPLCSAKVLKLAIECMLKSEGEDIETRSFIDKAIKQLARVNIAKQRNLANPFIPVARRPKSWEELRDDLLLKLEGL